MKNGVLLVLEYLIHYSDPTHYVTSEDMVAYLEDHEVYVERKAIFRYVQTLREHGFDIECIRRKGYCLKSALFEPAEISLLVDAINTSSYLSAAKSEILINKILHLTTIRQQEAIMKRFVPNDHRSPNEKSYQTISSLQEAITTQQLISFRYFDYNLKREKRYRRQASYYQGVPYALTYQDQRYYAIIYSPSHQSFGNYRIAKMDSIELKGYMEVPPLDLNSYIRATYRMFTGRKQDVTLKFPADMEPVIFDELGMEPLVETRTDEYFIIHIERVINDAFVSWVFQFMPRMTVIGPETLKEKLIEKAEHIMNTYKEERS